MQTELGELTASLARHMALGVYDRDTATSDEHTHEPETYGSTRGRMVFTGVTVDLLPGEVKMVIVMLEDQAAQFHEDSQKTRPCDARTSR